MSVRLVSAEQMRGLDRRAIEDLNIPSLILMENAGLAVAGEAKRMLGGARLAGRRVAVACGRGNNGGDGLVAARHLANAGADVTVALWAGRGELAGDAATNLGPAEACGARVVEAAGVSDGDLLGLLRAADLVIDALLGTGARGAPSGELARAVRLVNECGRPVLAVDIPSGLDPDTGATPGDCVRATCTVTLGLPKRGLYLHPGAGTAGRVAVADISLPRHLLDDPGLRVELVEPGWVASLLPHRARDAHKGTCGHVLVVAGSQVYSGAAVLCAMAALRAGAGVVTLGVPECILGIVKSHLAEVIARPLRESKRHALCFEALEQIQELAPAADVVAIGPGLSDDPDAVALARGVAREVARPLVIDADGLRAFSGDLAALRKRRAPTALTPHPGEMARLSGATVAAVRADPIGAAQAAAAAANCTVVLKGSPTVTAGADGRAFINSSGNPGLATAGSGDVLTGTIAGLAAQGMDLMLAAVAGVFIHGAAADVAAQSRGERGLVAGDVLAALPAALKRLDCDEEGEAD